MITRTTDTPTTRLEQVDPTALPEGDVTVAVDHSGLNYKDALAITRGEPVVRRFPMIPGIDLAGRVSASSDPLYRWGIGSSPPAGGWVKATGAACHRWRGCRGGGSCRSPPACPRGR